MDENKLIKKKIQWMEVKISKEGKRESKRKQKKGKSNRKKWKMRGKGKNARYD